MSRISRRKFLGQTTAAALVAGAQVSAAQTGRPSAVDPVQLGRTGIKASRLGLGTGSQGGRIQRELGQERFTRLVRYAYDQGIRYFDLADAYRTHVLFKPALRTFPREKLFIQTKIGSRDASQVDRTLDRFRKELGTDYLDSVLIHCVDTEGWPEVLKPMREALSRAKEKKVLRAHGVSCHGLKGLSATPPCGWVDVALVRINPQGKHVDGPTGRWDEPGDVDKALAQIRKLHAARKGVIGMKIIGNGDFRDPADREKSIRFVMGLDCVDAIVIGFAAAAEIDEAIRRINAALAG